MRWQAAASIGPESTEQSSVYSRDLLANQKVSSNKLRGTSPFGAGQGQGVPRRDPGQGGAARRRAGRHA